MVGWVVESLLYGVGYVSFSINTRCSERSPCSSKKKKQKTKKKWRFHAKICCVVGSPDPTNHRDENMTRSSLMHTFRSSKPPWQTLKRRPYHSSWKGKKYLPFPHIELRGRGAWFFVAFPAGFSSLCGFFSFFFNQNKEGGGLGPLAPHRDPPLLANSIFIVCCYIEFFEYSSRVRG